MHHYYSLLYIAQNMLTCNTPKKYAHIYTYAFHCLMTCLHMLLLLHDIRTPDYAWSYYDVCYETCFWDAEVILCSIYMLQAIIIN